MSLLASADVIEASATDLVGQYVGQTGPKTQALLEKALGKVLLIDEAYRLGEGPFAKEAMDEIVDCITKPKYYQKLIIILAGYDTDINHLMAMNPGLTSRFPESIEFHGLRPDHCVNLLTELLRARKTKSSSKLRDFDLTALDSPSVQFQEEMTSRFATLVQSSNWANARDVQTLGKAIFGECVRSIANSCLAVKEEIVLAELDQMIAERSARERAQPSLGQVDTFTPDQPLALGHQHQPEAKYARQAPVVTEELTDSNQEQANMAQQGPEQEGNAIVRDAGVTDDVWTQLQIDRQAAEESERQYEQLVQQEHALHKLLEQSKAQETTSAKDEPVDSEEKRRHEQERIRRELERRAQENELERLRKEREAAEKRRREEQQAQKKLREMGVCCAGFRWIKQAHGYRCAGGSHYVSNEQLGF